jgi:hypothetical protein
MREGIDSYKNELVVADKKRTCKKKLGVKLE